MLPRERADKILEEIRGVRSLSGVSDKAVTFLEGLSKNNWTILSGPQERWLRDIEKTVFRSVDDD